MANLATRLLLAATLGLGSIAHAQQSPPGTPEPDVPAVVPESEVQPSVFARLKEDAKAYFTAPLHWDAADWLWFGGGIAAIAASHHYDNQVRTHFIKTEGPNVGSTSDDLQDALPTVAVLGATWLYAGWVEDSAGRREAYNMLEASGLSTVSVYVIKFAAGREDPYQTSDPNQWFKSNGKSFPSEHTAAAFAVGTVLAESGNDEYRWLRRLLGYGLGVATGYERLKHNQHWLSDTVAGAVLGNASAHFVLNRHAEVEDNSRFALVPVAGGVMLTYRVTLQ
jgi:membrane-associated phospholipid phosphatase